MSRRRDICEFGCQASGIVVVFTHDRSGAPLGEEVEQIFNRTHGGYLDKQSELPRDVERNEAGRDRVIAALYPIRAYPDGVEANLAQVANQSRRRGKRHLVPPCYQRLSARDHRMDVAGSRQGRKHEPQNENPSLRIAI